MAFDVFISYPHQSKATADAACATLEAAGVRCWIAPRDIGPGSEWAGAIIDAIHRCRVMVLIFSSHANASKQIRREVQRAFDREVPVIPFRIENVMPEESLAYFMGPVHWLDALTPPLEQHLGQLVQSVNALLKSDSGRTREAKQSSAISNPANDALASTPKSAAAFLAKRPWARPRYWLFSGLAAAAIALCGFALLYVGKGPSQGSEPLSSGTIFSKFANSTTYIEAKWKLYGKNSGRPVYEKIVATKDGTYPCFVRLPNGTVTYWLTLDDGEGHNLPIQKTAAGTGFVVNEQGSLLTSRRIAAAWTVPYNDLRERGYQKGMIYQYGSASGSGKLEDINDDFYPTGAPVFSNDTANYLDSVSDHETATGRDDVLDVRFPGNRSGIHASLTGASTDSDTAVIKVEAGQKFTAVEFSVDDRVKIGDKMVVVGYSEVSAGGTSQSVVFVPEPTLAEGIIMRVQSSKILGDIYQLSSSSIRAGNNGGPVFNDKGHVVGLISIPPTSGAQPATVVFATPIKYGLALLTRPDPGN